MAKGIDNVPAETLALDLEQGKLDVNRLDLAKLNHREAFKQALQRRPGLLTKVSSANEKHFFTFAIKENPNYFVQLTRDQYSDELAQIYIFERLIKASEKEHNKKNTAPSDILVQKSLDDKTIFTYSYMTPEGDELYYLDSELQVPVSLKSNLVLTLKLDNAVALIDQLDTHITQLGEKKIKAMIIDVIASQYKNYLNRYIHDKKVGYYTLCTNLNEIEEGFRKEISTVFSKYGISVSKLVIKKIAIPKDIQFRLEDQAFQIRQRRADVEADAEFAKISLASYEAKLAVMQKYPQAEFTLTEYEKDLALKRYLIKSGEKKEEHVDRTIKMAQKAPQGDAAVDKPDDIVPDIVAKPNRFRTIFFAIAAIVVFIALISMGEDVETGMTILGIGTVVLGLVAAFNVSKLTGKKVEPQVNESESTNDKAE